MVREYVGARYVPKFSDVNGGVWDNSYSYEAMEIVKNGNDFYTSKIPVPVGASITDTTYWVLTGNYNGAMISLSNRIDALEKIKTVDSRADISALQCNIGDIIYTNNSYPNDGISTTWIVASGTGDGYLSISLSGGLAAFLVCDPLYVHAHMVGAFPNTDCKAAIDSLIANVPCAQIHFGEGTYNFSGRIWLNDYQSLIGSGWNTVLYCTQDPVENHGEFIGIIHDSGPQIVGCKVKDLAIDMYVGTGEDVNAIGIVNAKDLLIEHVKIVRSNWRGIQLETGTKDTSEVVIKDCEIHGTPLNGIGLSHTSGGSLKNVRLENIRIYDPQGGYGGILIAGVDGGQEDMKNIVLDNIYVHTTADVMRALYCTIAHNVSINNFVAETTATGITAYIIQLQLCTNLTFNNIQIKAPRPTNDCMAIGVISCDTVLFNNMNISGPDLGVRVTSGSPEAQKITIANSIIETLRYYLVVDATTSVGLATGILSSKTSNISSPNFKEIKAS